MRTNVEGRFQLGQPLDGWGLGEAWRARDSNFRNRAVVVKFVGGDAVEDGALSQAFAGAVKSLKALRHPQLLALVHSGLHDGRAYVAYEAFEGVGLAQRLDEAGRSGVALDLDWIERVADLACAGLGAAHEAPQPLVHGAVHPTAFVLRQTEAGTELKALDLALAPFVDPSSLTPRRSWTAPERLRDGPGREPAPAEDVFPLGLLVVEMLLGHLDPARRDSARAVAVREGASRALRLRDDVPDGVWEVLDQALRHDPGTRFEHATALRDALHAAWRTRASHAPREIGGRTATAGPPDLSQLSSRRLSHGPDEVAPPAPGPPPPPPSTWGAGWESAPVSSPGIPSPWTAASSPLALPPLPAALTPPPVQAPSLFSPGVAPSGPTPWHPGSSDWASPDDNPWDVPSPRVETAPEQTPDRSFASEAPREQTRALDLDALHAASYGSAPRYSGPPSEHTQALDLDALQAAPPGRPSSPERASGSPLRPASGPLRPGYDPQEMTGDAELPDDDTPADGVLLPDDPPDDGPMATLTPGQFRPAREGEDWRDAVMMLDTAAMARALPPSPMAATTRPPTRSPGQASPNGGYDDDGATAVQSRGALGGIPQGFAPDPTRPAAPRRPATMQAPTVPRRAMAPEADPGATLKPVPRSSVLPDPPIAPGPGYDPASVPPDDLFAAPSGAHRMSPQALAGSLDPFAPPGLTPTGTMPLPRASLPLGLDPYPYPPPTSPGPGMPGYVPPPLAHPMTPAARPRRGRAALIGGMVLLVLLGLALTLLRAGS